VYLNTFIYSSPLQAGVVFSFRKSIYQDMTSHPMSSVNDQIPREKVAWGESVAKTSNEFQIYKRRWGMLLLFSFLSLTNAMLWITYSPISRFVLEHYNIGVFALNSLSFVYMVVYIPVMYLASWVVDVRGMRLGLIIGALLNCIGAWVRYIGKDADKFYLAVTGQTIAALAQTFILGVPPKLAANWFPAHERATATTIGALFNELGIAFGFLIGPSIVKSVSDIPKLLFINAIICTVVGLTVAIFFRGEPPTPPSKQATVPKEDFKKAFRVMLQNRSFLFLVFSFGSTTGVFYAITTVLDQIIGPSGYTADDAGWLGFIMIISGITGALGTGIAADKTHKYKLLLLITFTGALLSLIGFLLCIRPNFAPGLYALAGLFGAFITSILPVSLEGAAECAFPVPEAISGGTTMMSAQAFGILFIVILSVLADQKVVSLFVAAWGLCAFVAASWILIFFFRDNRIRQLQAMEVFSELEPTKPFQTTVVDIISSPPVASTTPPSGSPPRRTPV
jgi:MFS family permease